MCKGHNDGKHGGEYAGFLHPTRYGSNQTLMEERVCFLNGGRLLRGHVQSLFAWQSQL